LGLLPFEPAAPALAELNGPDVVDLNGFTGCVAQRAEGNAPAFRIEGVLMRPRGVLSVN